MITTLRFGGNAAACMDVQKGGFASDEDARVQHGNVHSPHLFQGMCCKVALPFKQCFAGESLQKSGVVHHTESITLLRDEWF